jgi:hypothetical protein
MACWRRLGGVVLALWLQGALHACTTYRVQQSSLVPMAVPPSPARFDSRGDALLGGSTVAHVGQPDLFPSDEAGLYVPRIQGEGQVAVRAHRRGSVRLLYREGFHRGALPSHPTLMPNPGRNTRAAGAGYAFRLGGFGERWSVDLAAELMVAGIPSYVHVTTDDDPVRTVLQYDLVPVFSGSIVASHEISSQVRVFCQFALQTHPTNRRDFTSTRPRGEVYMGAPNLILGIGFEMDANDWLSLLPQLHWPATAAPVRYGPIITLALRARFGDPPARSEGTPHGRIYFP